MKCPKCKGSGKVDVDDGMFIIHGYDCDHCLGTGYIEPMTNEEYIRTCSTSELAILLYKIGFYSNITDDVMNTALMENIPTEEAFEMWLKEIHK